MGKPRILANSATSHAELLNQSSPQEDGFRRAVINGAGMFPGFNDSPDGNVGRLRSGDFITGGAIVGTVEGGDITGMMG